MNKGRATEKPSSQILRERLGTVPGKAKEISRKHAQIKRILKGALAAGPRTVPELVRATGLPSRDVFWHVMSLKKYGDIVEGAERGNYVEYALKAKEERRQ